VTAQTTDHLPKHERATFLDQTVVEEIDDSSSFSVFEGDEGSLLLPQRQCLVVLLKNHVITADKNPKEWATLLDDPRLIQSRLNDLLLDLVVDRERGVAFKVQVRSDMPGRFPPLLRDTAYTREETILLIFLRHRYMTERSGGAERVHVDRQECLDNVAGFRPAHATDVIGDRVKANNALETIRTAGVLVKTADADRFLIAPVIEALLPMDTLHALLEWFIEENRPGAVRETVDAGEEAGS
jgi:hypothetical protein